MKTDQFFDVRFIYLDASLDTEQVNDLEIWKNYKSPWDRDDAKKVTAYVEFFHK